MERYAKKNLFGLPRTGKLFAKYKFKNLNIEKTFAIK